MALLDSDREFLRRANVGGEFMKEEDIARVWAGLAEIARRTA